MTTPTEVLAVCLFNRKLGMGDGFGLQAAELLAVLDAAGWAIVPKVPTPEMLAAGNETVPDNTADITWDAMLAAATKP